MTYLTTSSAIGSLPRNTVGFKVTQRTEAEQPAILDAPIFLAPERGDPLTRYIECVPCVDYETLTPSQRDGVQLGKNVVEAYWKAIQSYPLLCAPHQWPMVRCILSALTVRDIFHAIGRADASVAPVGVKMVRMHAGHDLNVMVLGDPGAPVKHNMWNAHMVVQVGNIIFDPTHGQLQRPWNAAPDALAVACARERAPKVSLQEMGKANVVADYRYSRDGYDFAVTYFKLTRSVVERTRDWYDRPDARHERRQPIVKAALEILRGTLSEGGTLKVA
ncbi:MULTISPECIES: hypothetical protein [unclassified Rhizobium]|uniref:hypothetical protein n=1 Tax=unclassified Rhizobium TaxID=2613769 RepID=UPI0007E96940|nr:MULTISPECIES: hypothetical protein [unclassified Rhizobium]ANM09247.1 hypothetical protein AMK05_CH00818 [Rhizobium sp. N324]OYD02815.1 hypothetical protein AMK08_CH100814 [Rhizobium sp. N4311]